MRLPWGWWGGVEHLTRRKNSPLMKRFLSFWGAIINLYQPLSTFINLYQPLSTLINPYQPLSTF